MPILEIEIVGEPGAERAGLAQRLADAAGRALGSRPRGTWVRLWWLPHDHYAENGGEDGPRPVFVSVIERDVPPPPELAPRVRALTRAIAEACGRPDENVHVLYQAPARGRMAFGGALVD
jgi:phenylpyruvate tautomerase PptA (4-oxalocrotonate tautomerase family)